MARDMEHLYTERLKRYTTALRNGKPDRIPIRPFVAEFTARYAGYTCQEVTHDYEIAFAAARKCAADFDWDAVVANMVYGWSGLTQAIGLKYYAVPGIDIPADVGFQYLEPPEEEAFMKADEYDALTSDPTAFLFNVWLPRVATDVKRMGSRTSFRNNLSFLKGGIAMMKYFGAFGTQVERLRKESGTVSAICGMLSPPRHPGRQAARLPGAVHGPAGTAREGQGSLRSADAALVPSGPHQRRPSEAGAHRNLDAPRLRALHFAPAL
jgi:hypothetical protein